MPWNEADRAKYEVIRARYSSDMSEAELALIAPLLPPPKRRGRKPTDPRISKRGKSPGGGAFFACADSAAWILYVMCHRRPRSPI